ncbi:uncharacterized protein [Lepeophtheirus salmonis]
MSNFNDNCMENGVYYCRIVGGKIVHYDIPFFALLIIKSGKQLGDAFHCGSTVITPRLLLSAAHCVCQDLYTDCIKGEHGLIPKDEKKIDMIAIIGLSSTEDIEYVEKSERLLRHERKIITFIAHMKYKAFQPNDIAILKMDRDLPNDLKSAPICLFYAGLFPDNHSNLNATVIGFGHRWSRRTCMTDAIGPHPYRSCSFPYWASQIDMFTGKKLKKVQYNKCNHFPNPSNLNPICRKFNLFYQNEINEDYSTVDVVMSNNSWVRCYTENDLGNGWCGICNSFECQLGRDIPDGDEDWSWCARDCSGSDVIHSHSGTLDLQTVDVDLLTDEECSEFTQNFTTVNTTIELCAGYKHYISMPTKYSYIVLPNGTDHFLKISDTIKTNKWILGGKDACQGDSGGPLFITLGTSEDTKRAFFDWNSF